MPHTEVLFPWLAACIEPGNQSQVTTYRIQAQLLFNSSILLLGFNCPVLKFSSYINKIRPRNMIPIRFVPVVLYISTVVSQSPSLMAATENRPDLSMFRQLLINNPGPARTLLSNTPVAPGEGKTLLLPNNDAFANFEQENGTPVEGASENFMSALLNYHTLNGDYTNEQLNQPGGMTAPSALLDDTYNHRVPVTEVAQPKDGQVVLITQVAGLGQFQTRAENPLYAQSGLGKQIGVNQTSTDWVGGKFHVVNGQGFHIHFFGL